MLHHENEKLIRIIGIPERRTVEADEAMGWDGMGAQQCEEHASLLPRPRAAHLTSVARCSLIAPSIH
jgi:hypothetical protein